VQLATVGERLTIKGGNVEFREPQHDVADYPKLPDPDTASTLVSTDGEGLQRIAAVLCAVGTDPTLPVLTSVLLENRDGLLTAVGTDRYRMAVADTPLDCAPSPVSPLLVPAHIIRAARAAFRGQTAPIQLGVLPDGCTFVIRCGQRVVTGRLHDGVYPKYRGLLPEQADAVLTVPPGSFAAAVRAAAAVLDAHSPVNLTLTRAAVSVDGGVRGDHTLPTSHVTLLDATWDGQDMEVGFNPRYLQQGIVSLRGAETVQMATTAAHRAVVLSSPQVPGYRYLLMPVRISS
jgi:DNA polymerase-3 subunit beta